MIPFIQDKGKRKLVVEAAILVVALLILGGILFKVGESPQSTAVSITEAQLIGQITQGLINADDDIRVHFNRVMVGPNMVGQSFTKRVFSFTPACDGFCYWLDEQTLVFKPNQPLAKRQSYLGLLDIPKLLPTEEAKKFKPLHFTFEVVGLEISSCQGDFQVPDPGNPSGLHYRGEIVFSEKVDLAALKKSTSLTMDGKEIKLYWDTEQSGPNYLFKTENIKKELRSKSFVLRIKQGLLEMTADFENKFSLDPLSEFYPTGVVVSDNQAKPVLKVTFNDLLKPQQDIRGLISIASLKNLNLKISKKEVYLLGDFHYGQSYTVTVNQGIRNRWETKSKVSRNYEIDIDNLKPSLMFASDGYILPSANQETIRFKTVNLKSVVLVIKKVFENNLYYFLQSEQMGSAKDRRRNFNQNLANRVGVEVVKQKLKIGEKKNSWLQHEISLKKLLNPEERGLYLICLSPEDDLLTSQTSGEEAERENEGEGSYGYRSGGIYKPIIRSDIGLTCKIAGSSFHVYATDIIFAKPMNGVAVKLKTFQNQLIAQAVTDSNGMAVFPDLRQGVFFVEGEKGGQRNIVKPNEMGWNVSSFDVAGEKADASGIRAFIYTERGVYRPGDEINLSLIARNEQNTFPENHPITMEVFNPKNQVVAKQTEKNGRDGFYSFRLQTREDALTGNWRASFQVGSRVFTHPLKIETIVPYRLKLKLDPDKAYLTQTDREIGLNLKSMYLMGNPSPGLAASIRIELGHLPKKSSKFPTFSFGNEAVFYKSVSAKVFEGKLDTAGEAHVDWSLPGMENVPSALSLLVISEVIEKGGRPVRHAQAIPYDPYDWYVGLEKPELRNAYSGSGQPITFKAVCIDRDGDSIAGRPLAYRIYKNTRYWWWEYDSRETKRYAYKTDTNTELVKEGSVISKKLPQVIRFSPEDSGQYLVEVSEGSGRGHTAGFFFLSYYEGDGTTAPRDAGMLLLKSDRRVYHPGEEAVVSFPTPKEGMILWTVEKGIQIIQSEICSPSPENRETKIKIPITAEMTPNVYISISVIQPHKQTANDRPIRMYGVLPLLVEEATTRLQFKVAAPGELESGKPFAIGIQTTDNQPAQFTVAVVDEGLLALTDFLLPDPWQAFFKKISLDVLTSDLYAHIIDANRGDVFKRFAVGGEVDGFRKQQLSPVKPTRFKPVSLFQGPLTTDEKGHLLLKWRLPEYIGAVRVMVIGARGKSYGNQEREIPVKTKLMILPTLPRVLGPEDLFTLPITVFAFHDAIKEVKVALKVTGPISVQGTSEQTIRFVKQGEQDVSFRLRCQAALGNVRFVVSAVSGAFSASSSSEISLRPSSPRVYETQHVICEPGKIVKLMIPAKGIPGSNHASLVVMRKSLVGLDRRLQWLIHYPYGCIEQTTSSVFPQLFLKEFIKNTSYTVNAIDTNINAGIQRMRSFQTSSGGFSYWPGETTISSWGTNYAGHFLLEAQNQGYSIPPDMLQGWLRHQKSEALKSGGDLMDRVYRVYLLALAGEPQIGAMNLLKENELEQMNDCQKWILSAAYQLAGSGRIAQTITLRLGNNVGKYNEQGGTYGSGERDLAIILESMVLLKKWAKADEIYELLSQYLASEVWYSTQSSGYMLMALGKYLIATGSSFREQKPIMVGTIVLPDGKRFPFKTENLRVVQPISQGFGKEVVVEIDSSTTIKRGIDVVLNWNGVPLNLWGKAESSNLTVKVDWLDEDGMVMDPTQMPQGKSFWAHLRVGKTAGSSYQSLQELALVQLIPSGWEIENLRVTGENAPGWMKKWVLHKEEYLDIRDDRIMWFFDLPYGAVQYDFVVKLHTVTVGEFVLPMTVFEAMYDNLFRAVIPGKKVTVSKR
jgi:uncharacterized protein YfaS (alpha-2-macroglobulin family)